MPDFDSVPWFVIVIAVAVLGGAVTLLAWRRRGAAPAMMTAGVTLLFVAAYLTGVLRLAWRLVAALVELVVDFTFSPTAWLGLIFGGIGLLLLVVGMFLRRRAARKPAVAGDSKAAASRGRQKARKRQTAKPAELPAGATKEKTQPTAGNLGGADDDMAEIDAILKRRGIG